LQNFNFSFQFSHPLTQWYILTTAQISSEADENFFINLSNKSNGTIIDTQAVGKIVDNDAPPAITIGDTVQC
jgi:hypothetical protein